MTYKAVGRSIINYAAPVCSTNLRDTNYINIHYTQNEALRISTGCHKMSSVDHLHPEENMLKVKEHSELLSAQYLARCLEPENVNFSITTREPPKSMMKDLWSRPADSIWELSYLKARYPDLNEHGVKGDNNNPLPSSPKHYHHHPNTTTTTITTQNYPIPSSPKTIPNHFLHKKWEKMCTKKETL